MIQIFGRQAAHTTLVERKLAVRVRIPNENYTSYPGDVLALGKCADKGMAGSEKVQHILKGINVPAFSVLLVLNPT